MGVKGLVSYLEKKIPRYPTSEVLRRGTTLVIDASGFLFHVFRKQSASFAMKVGDYHALHSLLSDEINILLESGFFLIIVFDGKSQMKGKLSRHPFECRPSLV